MNSRILKCLGLLTLLMMYNLFLAQAQKDEESFNRTANFTGNSSNKTLIIDNINGNVTVEGYSGNQVQIEVTRVITGDSNDDIEEGKRDLKFVVDELEDTVFIYIDSPHIIRKKHGNNIWWNWQHAESVDYDFRYDIRIKTPSNVNLHARTINRGAVKIKSIYAQNIRASNVNGDVTLQDVSGTTRATTVNGIVDVSFKENPTGNCKFSTVNGDITVHLKKNLSAQLQFKSMHGQFYSDFNVSGYLPTQVKKEKDGSSIRYSINKYTGVKVGQGDVDYKLETLNGDIYVKKH